MHCDSSQTSLPAQDNATRLSNETSPSPSVDLPRTRALTLLPTKSSVIDPRAKSQAYRTSFVNSDQFRQNIIRKQHTYSGCYV